MSPNVIQEAIFKAVDVILEKRLKALKLNYCIEGIIDSDAEYDEKGELFYWVDYQGLRLKSYPVSAIHQTKQMLSVIDNIDNIDLTEPTISSIYEIGDLVYTLIINGDLNKRRLILCKV